MNKKALHRRRIAHVKLFGAGNPIQVIAPQLAKEFGCTEKAVYTDHERMPTWAPDIEEDERVVTEIKARLKLTNRRAINIMLDDGVGNKFVTIAAIHAVLKVTDTQIDLLEHLGIIKPAPITVQHLSMTTPCEADPVLKRALEAEIEKQRLEKAANERARAERDAAAKSADAGGQ